MQNKELTVGKDLKVTITTHQTHEFLMTSKEVAKGYGIDRSRLSHHTKAHSEELYENKHFVKGVRFSHTLGKNAQPHQVFWTKRGVVRLGFFIKSERAKMFRNWAEDLILDELEGTTKKELKQNLKALPEAPKRKHNRLTQTRLVSILQDIALIDDKALRLRLIEKLK